MSLDRRRRGRLIIGLDRTHAAFAIDSEPSDGDTKRGYGKRGSGLRLVGHLAHNMAIVTTAAAIAIENVWGGGDGGIISTLGAHGKMMGGRGRGRVQG